MKRPTVASLKKLSAENLEALGSARLAALLMAAAEGRPELKRKLRMELAAAQGVEHLAPEVDKRLASLETSRSKVSWRARPAFIRDVEALRSLIVGRLAEMDAPGALARLWTFMGLAPALGARVRDKHGELAAVFERAAVDIGRLAASDAESAAAGALVQAMAGHPGGWRRWLPDVLAHAPPGFAADALARAKAHDLPRSATRLVRLLADAAGDVDAFLASFEPGELDVPANAAEAGRRLLAAGRVEEAGERLRAAAPEDAHDKRTLDPAWETAWIDYLDAAGRSGDAQAVRWTAFQRALSLDHARAFVRRLPDFEDVEAEGRVLAHASAHRDFKRALGFLIDWPAIPEAAAMIRARLDEAALPPELAQVWAGRLRVRQPAAAAILLRKASAAAFRRREFAVSTRLSEEADTLDPTLDAQPAKE